MTVTQQMPIEELKAQLANPSRATRMAIPLFAELIEEAGASADLGSNENAVRLIWTFARKHKTGSMPFGWANAACIALLEAGIRPPMPRAMSSLAWELRSGRHTRVKWLKLEDAELEEIRKLMNGEAT